MNLFFIVLFLTPSLSLAKEKLLPLMEVGFAGGAFWLPHYPGSKETQNLFFAFPYFVYRGNIFKTDKHGGATASLFSSPRHKIDVSFGASFPSNSTDTVTRKDMPNLDWLFEFGPRYAFTIFKDSNQNFTLSIPLRFVYSTDFKTTTDRGITFQPQLKYHYFGFEEGSIGMSTATGLYFSTQRTNQYFYDVDQKFVTSDRQAYKGKGGYGGMFLRYTTEFHLSSGATVMLSLSKNYYSGSANMSSPLLNSLETQSYHMGFIWPLWASEELSSHTED